MSVLIKGMDMPKNCFDCPCFTEHGYDFCELDEERRMVYDGKPDWCPLVFVPTPHGDLIDRTKLYEDTANWEAQALEQVDKYSPYCQRDDWRWWSAVLKERTAFKHDVADAQTVIEAEEE